MKTVFILGAGASKAAGAPLMGNFLDVARTLNRSRVFANHQAAIDDVLQAADSDLMSMYAKSHLDLTNIEELFSAIDMGAIIGKFGARSPESIANLRASIITFIYRTIEETITIPSTNGGKGLPAGYGDLAEVVLQKVRRTAGAGSVDVSFITFNYDTALEYALSRKNLGIDYCLGEPFAANNYNNAQINIPVLKLHGSINWGRCAKCGKLVPTELDELDVSYIPGDVEAFRLPLGSRLAMYSPHSCGGNLEAVPFLVPPTWNKSNTDSALTKVWQRAAMEIGRADNIVIVGYSFPRTDTFFKYLMALGSQSNTRHSKILVLNGPENAEVRKGFEKLMGVVSRNVLDYKDFVFELNVRLIRELLDESD